MLSDAPSLFLYSMHMYFYLLLLSTLFYKILLVMRLIICVVRSLGYEIKCSPAVSRTLFVSFFCGL